ncbi:hypothetical protein BO82DRAFT_401462 [Aspergillus uvarum CBS 121591]|uniref:Uncharacterized protein n=1 Tax=Aspergillus uvarum CBS 121591 TaxID=1448315 RepID=A0A319CUG6_9EURO|nr:hypothetical protein BO82DRAFT_401462 [Aspergillus uvarum CBS 121591]PYH82473.1 hypothetical protein BO82DRAFT_401462 [Aspergillus uvarum CBS 121591]
MRTGWNESCNSRVSESGSLWFTGAPTKASLTGTNSCVDFSTTSQKKLQPSNGLDLDAFRLKAFQDPSFDGATAAVYREQFNKWAAVAVQEEHGKTLEEALMHPADPETIGNFSGYVRIVNGQWCPESDSDEEAEADNVL